MPELPEVETIVGTLRPLICDRTITRVVVHRRDVIHGDPRPLGRLLRGRRIVGVARRAKRVVLTVEPPADLIFHLGMSGRLTLDPSTARVAKHTHVRLGFAALGKELRFRDPRRFGGVWCMTDHAQHIGKKLGPLGPEPLDLNTRRFARLLSRRRSIKSLLLDQRLIAGLGNIYCDEALYAARIHPQIPADRLSSEDAKRLLRAIKSTLRSAIRFKGSTLRDYRQVDGSEGGYAAHHRAYGRADQPCKRCGVDINRIRLAGRSTFFCPRCQPTDS